MLIFHYICRDKNHQNPKLRVKFSAVSLYCGMLDSIKTQSKLEDDSRPAIRTYSIKIFSATFYVLKSILFSLEKKKQGPSKVEPL